MAIRPTLASSESTRLVTAMLCAATVTGQFVAGKALRDTLFLSSLDVTSLPAMLIATSAVSLLLVALNGRVARRLQPGTLVPALFLFSSLLFVVEWALRSAAPTASAILLYLHVSAAGPLLASGFWLIASERFDPHTAKRRFGQMAGAGTLGGLVSAVVAERAAAWFGAPAILPILALLQAVSAVLVRRLAEGSPIPHVHETMATAAQGTRSGLRVIAEAPYLRHLGDPGAAGYDRCGAGRLPLQGTGGRHLRTRRSTAPLLCAVLRRNQHHHVRPADLVDARRARAVRSWRHGQHAVAGAAAREHRRADRARVRQPGGGARRRVDPAQFAVPCGLRALLHADSVSREACREVVDRRGLRSAR